MTTIVSSRQDSDGNLVGFYDTTTQETIARFMPIAFDEDFLGAGHQAGVPAAGAPAAGYAWVKKTVGAATVSAVANAPGGVMQCALAVTGEKEDAALYQNDQLQYDATKSLAWEASISFPVLPTVAGVEAVFGLQSVWIDGPDNAAFYLQFQLNGSGLVNMRTKDGINTLSASTGITLLPNVFHNFKITLGIVPPEPAIVTFSIDGLQTSTSGQFTFGALGANAVLQPYMSCYKPSGTGVATMNIDMVQVYANRVT